MEFLPVLHFCFILGILRLSSASCPFHEMSKAEKLHQNSLASINDSADRAMFEYRRSKRDSILSDFKSYVKHCVKPVLRCGAGYRTYSGLCNNFRNYQWGAVHSCLLRILPANYADGVAEPSSLPTASSISVKLRHLRTPKNSTSSLSNLFFAFGQFFAHDIANSVITQINGVDCCDAAGRSQKQCEMRIDVTTDPFFRKQNVSCINFIRSARCPCSSGPRNQINGATSFIDLSQVYGSDELLSNFLKDREHRHLLKTEPVGQLPLGGSHCVSTNCFFGGDERINQQAALTTMHTLFLRTHNHLAEELRKLNPHWSSLRLFEEARKISIAQYQVVLLKEFFPSLLGDEILERSQLSFKSFLKKATLYEEGLEPGMFNEFVAAAFRLHVMVPERLRRTPFNFFNVDDYFLQNVEDRHTSIVRELISTRMKYPAFPASTLVSRHVYDTDGDFGLDLIAINIQRGRDHGLRPYVDYLAKILSIKITEFDDLATVMDDDAILMLRSAYADVADVDLYVGGHLERKVHGVLGSLMAELVVMQLERIMASDRYFVTHRKYFTKDQFKALARTSLTDTLCAATDLSKVPRNPFKIDSKFVSCSKRAGLDLTLWKSRDAQ